MLHRFLISFFLFSIIFLSNSLKAQPPLKQGQAVMTFALEASTSGSYSIEVIDVSDRSGQLPDTWWDAPLYHHPAWDTLGSLFGIALDGVGNIYTSVGSPYSQNYYGNLQLPSSISGRIYKIDGQTFIPKIIAKIDDQRWGFGNICYDKLHRHLFASCFGDGKIYNINLSNSEITKLDPFTPDNGSPDAVSNMERIWGLGIREQDGRLYFARHYDAIDGNQIYSVGIDNSGILSDSVRFEFTVFALSQNDEISDIEFSIDGKMLVAERNEPHYSRALEYVFNGSGWILNQVIYSGTYSAGTNCAGGVDYGYGYDSEEKLDTNLCQQTIWNSSNAMVSINVYGISSCPLTGNSNSYSDTNYLGNVSYCIDQNGSTAEGGQNKGNIGDVDIYDADCEKTTTQPTTNPLSFPTAFSPDGDGLNDFFHALNYSALNDFGISIYDRWGRVIFHSDDAAFKWDGTYKSFPQELGVYVWVIHYRYPNDVSNRVAAGNVTLVR